MSDTSLTRLAPEVRTLARPASGPLLAARAEVSRNADLQVAFVKATAEGWDAARLADEIQPLLEATLEGTPEALREAGLYLADEYLQDGDGILLVSRETGRTLARITEDDIWQPAPIRREDGSLVQPLPRIRPDLEGFLVQWVFDRNREAQVAKALAPWAAGTVAAQQVTRQGRQGLVQRIQQEAPNLLSQVGGRGRDFLASFDVVEADVVIPTGLVALPRATAFARTRTPLGDLRAFNMRYDVLAAQKGALGVSWVTEIARMLVQSCPTVRQTPIGRLWDSASEWPTFWVAPTDAADIFRQADVPAVFIESDRALGLLGRVGVLQLHPESYRVSGREIFDRWEVGASVDFTLWVDWSRIHCLRIENLPVQVTVL